jgi:hypothetical protein
VTSGSEGRNMEKIGMAFVSLQLRKPRGSGGKAFETGAQTVVLGRVGEHCISRMMTKILFTE